MFVIGNDFGGLWATNFAWTTQDSLASNQWQPLNSFLVVASGSQRRMPYLLPRLMIENVRFPNFILSAEPNSSVFMMIGYLFGNEHQLREGVQHSLGLI
jgi:hypothetical protein